MAGSSPDPPLSSGQFSDDFDIFFKIKDLVETQSPTRPRYPSEKHKKRSISKSFEVTSMPFGHDFGAIDALLWYKNRDSDSLGSSARPF